MTPPPDPWPTVAARLEALAEIVDQLVGDPLPGRRWQDCATDLRAALAKIEALTQRAEAAEREVARMREAARAILIGFRTGKVFLAPVSGEALIRALAEALGTQVYIDTAPASPEEGDQDDAAQANPSQPAWEVYDQTLTIEEMEALGYAPRREPDEEGDHAE